MTELKVIYDNRGKITNIIGAHDPTADTIKVETLATRLRSLKASINFTLIQMEKP